VGLAFSYDERLPEGLFGQTFVARWNDSITSSTGHQTYTYADLVAVNPSNGAITRIAEGFQNPLAVFALPEGGILVSDFGRGTIHTVRPLTWVSAPVPEPSSLRLALIAAVGLTGLAARSHLRNRREGSSSRSGSDLRV
jgi:hypothetical protein